MRDARFIIDLSAIPNIPKYVAENPKRYGLNNVVSIAPNKVTLFKKEDGKVYLSIFGSQLQNIPLAMTHKEAEEELKRANSGSLI